MKACKILLFLLFFLSCQIVFAQTVNSSITIRISNGNYLVSGIVKSDAVKNEVIEKVKAQLGSSVDFSKISVQAAAKPFQEDWQTEFDKSLSKIKRWKSGVIIFSNAERPPTLEYPPLPQEIANAKILLTDGQTVSPKDYRNKVLVLLLFASWVSPGFGQARDLNDFYKTVSSRNIEILGIDIEDSPDEKRNFPKLSKIYNLQYKLGYIDPKLVPLFVRFSKKEWLPQTFVILNGKIQDIFTAYSPAVKRDLEKLIIKTLNENNL